MILTMIQLNNTPTSTGIEQRKTLATDPKIGLGNNNHDSYTIKRWPHALIKIVNVKSVPPK